MFNSFDESPRWAQARTATTGIVSGRNALRALLAAVVVFLIQWKQADQTAGPKFGLALVAWALGFLVLPLIEFGWKYAQAPQRIAEQRIAALSEENARLNALATESSRRIFELETQLSQNHSNQAMADWLTEKHAYGVTELLNKKPTNQAELNVWLKSENEFTESVVCGIEERGGTPQDVHHVRTLGIIPMLPLHSNPTVNHRLSMLAERLNRIADVSSKYVNAKVEAVSH